MELGGAVVELGGVVVALGVSPTLAGVGCGKLRWWGSEVSRGKLKEERKKQRRGETAILKIEQPRHLSPAMTFRDITITTAPRCPGAAAGHAMDGWWRPSWSKSIATRFWQGARAVASDSNNTIGFRSFFIFATSRLKSKAKAARQSAPVNKIQLKSAATVHAQQPINNSDADILREKAAKA